MKNILTIFKKEWDRVIKDKRLVFSVILLPGLMIFLIYSFMGNAISNFTEEEVQDVAIVAPVDDFVAIYSNLETSETSKVTFIDASEVQDYKDLIDAREWELLIVFPADFENEIGDSLPAVELYFNPNEMQSQSAFSRYNGYLEAYRTELITDLFGDTSVFQTALASTPIDENEAIGEMMSMLLPMLVVMFLFAGAMSIGPESIAGEKERGTIATLLITPVKRSEIAMGKVLSLGILSLISAVSSFIGIISSLPSMLQMGDMDINIYGFKEYMMILVLLFSTVFVIVGVISVISAYAKSLKEANTLITPIYILTILVGVSSMFGGGANSQYFMYMIPLYNTVQSMTAILMFDANAAIYILITVISNLIYVTGLVFLLNKMFKSERMMFSK